MRNGQTGKFERVDSRLLTTSGDTIRLGPNFARLLDASGNVTAQARYSPANDRETFWRDWSIAVNQVIWAGGL